MTDYELIMIVLTILSLLIAVDIKNRKEKRTVAQRQLYDGSFPI